MKELAQLLNEMQRVGAFVTKLGGAPSWKLCAAMTILLPKKK